VPGSDDPAVARTTGPPAVPRATRPGYDLFVALAVTTTASLPVFLVATLAIEIRQSLHFGASALGMAVSLYYLGAAVGSVPLSRVVERVGGVRVLRVACLTSAALLVLLGTVTSSWLVLAVLLVPCGISSAAIAPASNLFLARRIRPARQGAAFGVKQAAIPLASLVGGLSVPAVALTLGWRWAFLLAGALALAAGLLVPPSRTPAAVRARSRPDGGAGGVDVVPLVILAAGLGLGVFAASGLAAFLATAAVSAGFARGTAGLIVAAAGGAAVIVRVASGVLADRRGGRHFPVVATMLAVGAVGYGMAAVGAGLGVRWLLVPAAVLALGAGWGWNGLFNFAVVRTHIHAPARATGITQVGGRLGGVLGPLTLGLVIDHASYAAAWSVATAVALLAAGAVLVGRHLLVTRRAP
jgi:MFS family permease